MSFRPKSFPDGGRFGNKLELEKSRLRIHELRRREREKRNTHTHKETKTEKGTDQGKVSNEIKAPDLEQFSCNWKNFDRRRVRESAISAKKKSSSARKLEPHQQKTNFARMEWSRVHKQICNCQCRRRRAASWSFCSKQLTDN